MGRLYLLLVCLPLAGFGQFQDSVKNPDLLRGVDAVIYTFAAPLKWKSKQWLEFGAIAGSTAILTLADQPVRNFWQNQESRMFDGVNDVGYHYGKPYCSFLFSGAIYSIGVLSKNEWLRETGMVLGTSLITAGILEMGLKPLFGRARPPTESGNYDITFFNKKPAYHSFPSGHASILYGKFCNGKTVQESSCQTILLFVGYHNGDLSPVFRYALGF